MDLKVTRDEMKAYLRRWEAVQAVELQEQQQATIEENWRQLNAIYGLALSLGLVQPDESEAGVHERWAKLKEKALI